LLGDFRAQYVPNAAKQLYFAWAALFLMPAVEARPTTKAALDQFRLGVVRLPRSIGAKILEGELALTVSERPAAAKA
jgi:hypothetical protein